MAGWNSADWSVDDLATLEDTLGMVVKVLLVIPVALVVLRLLLPVRWTAWLRPRRPRDEENPAPLRPDTVAIIDAINNHGRTLAAPGPAPAAPAVQAPSGYIMVEKSYLDELIRSYEAAATTIGAATAVTARANAIASEAEAIVAEIEAGTATPLDPLLQVSSQGGLRRRTRKK